MSFKTRRMLGGALVLSLLIQMQIATIGYAAPRAKIAFTCVGMDGNRDICVMDGDGGNEVILTDDPAWDEGPSWSPDGDRIVFASDRGDNPGLNIYVMDSKGRILMKLTNESSNGQPAWSPDGTKIAFTRSFRGVHIWVIDADGGNLIQLTHLGSNYSPAWSPDGVRIAFVSAKRHAEPEIYAMDSDGDNQVRLTDDLTPKDNPSWSPDGEWIAYDDRVGWLSQISVVRTDGSGRTKRLTDHEPSKGNPAWSPDGDTIAYVVREDGVRETIDLMTSDGRHLKQLTEDDGIARFDPDWFDPVGRSVSPAGNYLTIWGKIKEPASARR